MKTEKLLDQVLTVLNLVKDDKEKLQKLLDFMEREIYEEENETVTSRAEQNPIQPHEIYEEEDDETARIPEKYRSIVRQIAENIDCGLTCYLNPETLEIEDLPKDLDDPEEYELMTGERYDEMFKHQQWDKCIVVEPPESRESFKIMERFVAEVDDNLLRYRLIDALKKRRPFANFKYLVETSRFRQTWFDFKQQQLEAMVRDELQLQLDRE